MGKETKINYPLERVYEDYPDLRGELLPADEIIEGNYVILPWDRPFMDPEILVAMEKFNEENRKAYYQNLRQQRKLRAKQK